ncbi:MAG: hypothetical protein K1X95_13560 [Acidimicrobiia bacterium]|nr:hypothetical protein [Acidimicrobiia bacterium]
MAAVAVLVLGYVLHPSVRDRVFSASPVNSVGAFKRRMSALGHQSGHDSNWLDEPVYRASGRQVLIPAKPIGTTADSFFEDGDTTTAVSAQSAPPSVDTILNPPSALHRRQSIQVVLGSATAFFLVAGFFSRPLWIGAFVCLVAFLGYLGLLHEANRRESERERRRQIVQATRRAQQPPVPEPVQQVQRGYTIDLSEPEPELPLVRRSPDAAPARHQAGGPATRNRDRAGTPSRRNGPPRGSAHTPRRQVRRPIDF